jgi:hypothetical protein
MAERKAAGTLFIVDGIEGERARLVAADDDDVSFTIPLRYLPSRTLEGDHLRLRFRKDTASRAATGTRVKSLLDELAAEQGDEPEKFKL